MDLSGLSIADPSPSKSDQGTFGDASPLSPRLRDKLNKLAKWRIDPSLIEFPEDASEFEGGHATVSRALLTAASAARADLNKPQTAERGPSPPDVSIEKKVIAVKKLKTENDDNSSERVLDLALRETEFLVGLSSPRIIKLDGFVEDLPNNRIWLIFPWQECGNLKDFVAAQDWEIPERISLIEDVAAGVEYIHSRSPPIYHGDLKSINVLVTSECRAVITDFGSARRLAKKDVDPQMKRTEKKEAKPTPDFCATFCTASNTMTFTGNEYTLRWAAPELLMDEEPSLSSDIWALGWIFYEVMTNSVPFENVQKDSVIIKNVIDGNLPIVKDHVRISLILSLSTLMIKCWSIDPTERPTADDCRKSLNWMPMVVPAPRRGSDTTTSRSRSPELLLKIGNMYKAQGDCINASVLYTEALNLYTDSSDKEGVASALYGLGRVHRSQCEYSKAATLFKEVLQVCTEIGNTRGRVDALRSLAKLHKGQGEYDKAVELYSEVIQISLATGNKLQRAAALRGLAGVHRAQNDFDHAVTSYSEAVEIYTDIGTMLGRSSALWGLAEVYRLQAKYSEAVPLFSESLQISTDIGDRFGIANALWSLADIHGDRDQHREAISLYEQAAGIFEQIGNTKNAKVASAGAAFCRSQLESAVAE